MNPQDRYHDTEIHSSRPARPLPTLPRLDSQNSTCMIPAAIAGSAPDQPHPRHANRIRLITIAKQG
jgi:hypothetical protein